MRTKWAGVVLITMIVALAIYAWAQVQAQAPDIVTGPDIGFRVERTLRDRAVGTLMVRVDGKWVEAWVSTGGGVVPLHVK